MAAVREVAVKRRVAGGNLPFRFGRQAFFGPAREGVGLVEADVADRLGGIDRALAGQREDQPLAILAAPVERRLPALLLHRAPALRQPEFGPLVAALGDEI